MSRLAFGLNLVDSETVTPPPDMLHNMESRSVLVYI